MARQNVFVRVGPHIWMMNMNFREALLRLSSDTGALSRTIGGSQEKISGASQKPVQRRRQVQGQDLEMGHSNRKQDAGTGSFSAGQVRFA